MRICLHDDAERFALVARPLLDADPVRHTFALPALERVRAGGLRAAAMVTLHRRGEVAGVALRTDGSSMLVSAVPAACAVLVDAAVAGVDPAPPGVAGPVVQAEAYAAAVTARTGVPARVRMRQRLFRLVALHAPAGVVGSARAAASGDVELLVGWQAAFHAEALPSFPQPSAEGLRATVDRGGLLVWQAGGRPVAYAGTRQPIAGMSRVGPVYTPPEHRGHGYGSAVTAAATAWALAAGARDVVLLTDLANPVSNVIYPRIGYRPVHDTVELAFGPAEPAPA
ncbi:MAG: GNAT family N-acetyltransferase [Pseudonocardia sp.]